jgi:hypothetical protein
MYTIFFPAILKETEDLVCLSLIGRLILKLILNEESVKMWTGSLQGTVAGFCQHGNKPSGSIKGREFLDSLSDS